MGFFIAFIWLLVGFAILFIILTFWGCLMVENDKAKADRSLAKLDES